MQVAMLTRLTEVIQAVEITAIVLNNQLKIQISMLIPPLEMSPKPLELIRHNQVFPLPDMKPNKPNLHLILIKQETKMKIYNNIKVRLIKMLLQALLEVAQGPLSNINEAKIINSHILRNLLLDINQ